MGFRIFNMMLNMSYFPNIAIFARFGTWLFVKQWSMLRDTHKQLFFIWKKKNKKKKALSGVICLVTLSDF